MQEFNLLKCEHYCGYFDNLWPFHGAMLSLTISNINSAQVY